MQSLEEKYKFTTAEESVINKDWAAGSAKILEHKEILIGPTGTQYSKVEYPPALMKICDEPIVNAIDHFIRCIGTREPVRNIKITISDRVCIYNDGSGIECAIHKTASEKLGRQIWIPTFIFGTLFQGSNREKDSSIVGIDSIIGGTNGLGAKLSNCFSKEFRIETLDNERGVLFKQKWENNKSVEHPPMITPAKGLPYTLVEFLPDYSLFGYKNPDDVAPTLSSLVCTRAIFAAAYVGYISTYVHKTKNTATVYFNETKINITSMRDIARIMFPDLPAYSTVVNSVYPWEVIAVCGNRNNIDIHQISVANGVVVKEGKHTKHLLGIIIDAVKSKLSKLFNDKNIKFSPSLITNNLFIMVCAAIPDVSWTGQRKDILDIDSRRLSEIRLDTKFINNILKELQDIIVDSMVSKTIKQPKPPRYDKYVPARKAGTKYSSKCVLIPVEGDSAMTQVCTGISHSLGFEYYGAISLGGVIMNARRECTVINTSSGRHIKKSTKLINNIFINALMEITGLNINHTYAGKNKEKELKKLKYGCIVACVDQDLDGKGNILGLLLSTFELLWPELLRMGYVKWFCTPIIRAYPRRGGKVLSFYSTTEYDKWEVTNDISLYEIKYYKGIGTHSRDETIHMFKSFNENTYTYGLDERSSELFNIYFGIDPSLRKKELALPARELSAEKIADMIERRFISCSDHLEYETNMYQKDNLERKLDHIIDGQNRAGRKILDGVLKAFRKANKPMKVAQLAGYIAKYENYHQGETSLATSLTGKGFVTCGGKQLPLIIPLSNFGSRKGGGKDAAQPRYIWCILNKPLCDLLFPRADYHLLEFTFDEGMRGEPKYFVPIIPMAVIESTHLPGHGWKLKLWGRDVFKVIDNVRRLIRLSDDTKLLTLPPTVYKGAPYEWSGEIKYIRGEMYSFGRYSIDTNLQSLVITELPLRVWTQKYVTKLKEKALKGDRVIQSVHDESDDIKVNIIVHIKPGSLEYLEDKGDSYFTDGVEEYFQLRERMDSHINLRGMQDEVLSFNSYEDVMRVWFPIRKEYYARRIERRRLILDLSILRIENIINYIDKCNEMKMAGRSTINMEEHLTACMFIKINKAKLDKPGFTPTDKLRDVILGDNANYDYLLGLSDRQKSSEARIKYQQELESVMGELNQLNITAAKGRFPGAEIWEHELNQLEQVIRRGQETFWRYEAANKYTFS